MDCDPDRVAENQMVDGLGNLIQGIFATNAAVTCLVKPNMHLRRQWNGVMGKEEFVKMAGLVLMATIYTHDKNTGDIEFIKFLPLIKNNSTDNRNLVKKAVNWALRRIGKRN